MNDVRRMVRDALKKAGLEYERIYNDGARDSMKFFNIPEGHSRAVAGTLFNLFDDGTIAGFRFKTTQRFAYLKSGPDNMVNSLTIYFA